MLTGVGEKTNASFLFVFFVKIKRTFKSSCNTMNTTKYHVKEDA